MRIVSIAVSIAVVPIVYLTAKQFVENRFTIVAAEFFAIDPNLIENSAFAITEPVFILLAMISLYFAFQ